MADGSGIDRVLCGAGSHALGVACRWNVPNRGFDASAYDAAHGQVVLFGGSI
jgi:hypothetical protein